MNESPQILSEREPIYTQGIQSSSSFLLLESSSERKTIQRHSRPDCTFRVRSTDGDVLGAQLSDSSDYFCLERLHRLVLRTSLPERKRVVKVLYADKSGDGYIFRNLLAEREVALVNSEDPTKIGPSVIPLLHLSLLHTLRRPVEQFFFETCTTDEEIETFLALYAFHSKTEGQSFEATRRGTFL